jgi:hypothetical protein
MGIPIPGWSNQHHGGFVLSFPRMCIEIQANKKLLMMMQKFRTIRLDDGYLQNKRTSPEWRRFEIPEGEVLMVKAILCSSRETRWRIFWAMDDIFVLGDWWVFSCKAPWRRFLVGVASLFATQSVYSYAIAICGE